MWDVCWIFNHAVYVTVMKSVPIVYVVVSWSVALSYISCTYVYMYM